MPVAMHTLAALTWTRIPQAIGRGSATESAVGQDGLANYVVFYLTEFLICSKIIT